jgi:hypothetical protein
LKARAIVSKTWFGLFVLECGETNRAELPSAATFGGSLTGFVHASIVTILTSTRYGD